MTQGISSNFNFPLFPVRKRVILINWAANAQKCKISEKIN